MFCYNCGSQVPDGASFCPNCGRTLENPAAQPTYQQPDPTYTQPTAEQPTAEWPTTTYQQPYTQPTYQQPPVNGQQMYPPRKKSSTGKIVLIVVLCVVLIPLVLIGIFVGCTACMVCGAAESYSQYVDEGGSIEDFLPEDFNVEDFYSGEYDFGDYNFDDFYSGEYDFGDYDVELSGEFEPEILAGDWVDIYYGEKCFEAVDNGDGTFTLEGDAFIAELEYRLDGSGTLLSAELSDITPAAAPMYTATLTLTFEQYTTEAVVLIGGDIIEFNLSELDAPNFCYYKDAEPVDADLESKLCGLWEGEGWSIEFDASGAGEEVYGGVTEYFNWCIIGDHLTLDYNEESYMFYTVAVDGDELVLGYSTADDYYDFAGAEWIDYPFTRSVGSAV